MISVSHRTVLEKIPFFQKYIALPGSGAGLDTVNAGQPVQPLVDHAVVLGPAPAPNTFLQPSLRTYRLVNML